MTGSGFRIQASRASCERAVTKEVATFDARLQRENTLLAQPPQKNAAALDSSSATVWLEVGDILGPAGDEIGELRVADRVLGRRLRRCSNRLTNVASRSNRSETIVPSGARTQS